MHPRALPMTGTRKIFKFNPKDKLARKQSAKIIAHDDLASDLWLKPLETPFQWNSNNSGLPGIRLHRERPIH